MSITNTTITSTILATAGAAAIIGSGNIVTIAVGVGAVARAVLTRRNYAAAYKEYFESDTAPLPARSEFFYKGRREVIHWRSAFH